MNIKVLLSAFLGLCFLFVLSIAKVNKDPGHVLKLVLNVKAGVSKPVHLKYNKIEATFSTHNHKDDFLAYWSEEQSTLLNYDHNIPIKYCKNRKLKLCLAQPFPIFVPKAKLQKFEVQLNEIEYLIEVNHTNLKGRDCKDASLTLRVLQINKEFGYIYKFDYNGLKTVSIYENSKFYPYLERIDGSILHGYDIINCMD